MRCPIKLINVRKIRQLYYNTELSICLCVRGVESPVIKCVCIASIIDETPLLYIITYSLKVFDRLDKNYTLLHGISSSCYYIVAVGQYILLDFDNVGLSPNQKNAQYAIFFFITV